MRDKIITILCILLALTAITLSIFQALRYSRSNSDPEGAVVASGYVETKTGKKVYVEMREIGGSYEN